LKHQHPRDIRPASIIAARGFVDDVRPADDEAIRRCYFLL